MKDVFKIVWEFVSLGFVAALIVPFLMFGFAFLVWDINVVGWGVLRAYLLAGVVFSIWIAVDTDGTC